MRPVAFRPEAESEIESAYWWYEAQREGLGGEFLSSLARCLEAISENPHVAVRVATRTRRTVFGAFPTFCSTSWKVNRSS